MQRDVFYLHEDDWAMIDLLPAENFTELLRIANEAQVFGEEHLDGYGWTAMYKIPRPTYPLSLRALPLHDLRVLLQERFLQAKGVQSGYSSYRETLPDSFAFVERENADGVFYGEQKNEMVTALHLLPCSGEDQDIVIVLSDILHTLGVKYDLVLANWWSDQIIDLRKKALILHYLETSA